MNNTLLELPETFSSARSNLVKNLITILQTLNYTPTLLAIQLSDISSTEVFSSDITDWVNDKKLPNVYQLFKLSKLVNVPINSLFSDKFTPSCIDNPLNYCSDNETIVTVNIEQPLPIAAALLPTNQLQENTSMATKAISVTISKSSKKKMDTIIKEHTSSSNYNILLANKIYNSGIMLKDIAAKVGVSTRALRDYAFYGTTVPVTVAYNLVKMFKGTSYRNLGLIYNATTDRYEHRQIVSK